MAVLAAVAAPTRGAEERSAEARIKKVTVYPDRAQVARVGDLELPAGEHTVLIENLPAGVLDASFRVSASGQPGLTLLGLSHSTHEHLEAPIQKVAHLERELDSLERHRRQAIADRIEALHQLKNFVATLSRGAADYAATQVTNGGINVAQWSAAYQFVDEKSSLLSDSLRQARNELADIVGRIDMVRADLRKLSTVNQRTTKTVKIGLHLETAGKVQLTLEYIVVGATWTPMYDARIGDDPDQVDFKYHAEVSQKTGEDWTDVELTLSTASPSLGAGPGELTPWFLGQMPSYRPSYASSSTGQIRGRIVSGETGQPVIGASVLIIGSTWGAMTDLDGYFQILRVDPGVYTLRVSHLDFATTEITDVAVRAGGASEISQLMLPRVTDLDETIRVVGTKDIFDRFAVDSRVSIAAETPRQRPVQTVDNLLEQVAGVKTSAEREVFVRGGHGRQRAYIVDGVPTGDPLGASGLAPVSGSIVGSGAYPVVFRIKGTESVTSGGDKVRVTVANWILNGETTLIARPRNRPGTFRLVKVKNQDKAPLLSGSVTLFAGSHFLGHTYFNQLVAPGEEFDLPFGLDNHVTAEREVVAFLKTVKGDQVKTEQTVQITLRNLGSVVRVVDLEESLPVSRDGRIKVKTDKINPGPESRGDDGTLKWTFQLAPDEELKVLIPYQVKYPARLPVAGL